MVDFNGVPCQCGCMAKDMFGFSSPDLKALEKWAKSRPIEFGRAAAGVVNSLAFDGRKAAIDILTKGTTTRNKGFVKSSIRVTKARPRTDLSKIISTVGSVDLSKAGRSTGFEELERGTQSKNDRVPTLASRTSGAKSKQVRRRVRFNKLSSFHRHTKFPGKTKQAKVASMLRQIRSRSVERKPFIIPRGMGSGFVPGVYELQGKSVVLVNPFNGRRAKTKRLAWMDRTIQRVASPADIKRLWKDEADRLYKLRRR